MTVTCVAGARIPQPFLPDSCSMASVCQHAEEGGGGGVGRGGVGGGAAKQPEIEMITTSLCPSQAAR